MTVEIWILYVLTVLALMSTPGPSQLLMLSNSASYGFRKAVATAGGDLTANALQMLAAALGLGVLIASSQGALTVIKWFGVGYLIWHALRVIKNANSITHKGTNKTVAISRKTLYLQGFITSAANPKAVLFFAALFPQFIIYGDNFWAQFFILALSYLIIDCIFLSTYGITAGWIVSRLNPSASIWVNRIGGLLMLVAAVLLGFKSLDEAVPHGNR